MIRLFGQNLRVPVYMIRIPSSASWDLFGDTMNFTSAYLTSLLVFLAAPMMLFGQYNDPTTDQSDVKSSVQSDAGANGRVPGQRHVGADGQEYEWQLIPVNRGTQTSTRAPLSRGIARGYDMNQVRSYPMGAPAYSSPAPAFSGPIVSAPVVSAPVVAAPAPVIQTRVVYVPRPVVVPRPVFIQPAPVFFQPAPTVFIAPQPRRKKHSCLFRH